MISVKVTARVMISVKFTVRVMNRVLINIMVSGKTNIRVRVRTVRLIELVELIVGLSIEHRNKIILNRTLTLKDVPPSDIKTNL